MTVAPTLAMPCPTASLFHTPTSTAFIDLEIQGHRETWPVRGKQLRAWLRRRYYKQPGEALGGETIRSIVDLLEARAQFDAPERTVHVRVAEHEGRIYLDLADKDWRAVEVGPDGWRCVGAPPVRFRRAPGMLPLPVPQRGGSIDALASLLNLPTANDFALAVAWLLTALRPSGPYPLLVVAGEQGSAKTTLTKILRALVDPNMAPARSLPREERDLMIAANNGHVLAFDNLSGMPSWLSDGFCRLASGGGFALRQLFTDEDEILFHATRPVILNGIEDVVCRPDLVDRAVFLTLDSISDDRRRPEKELWREFEIARPRILGALLDGVVHGLRRLPHIRLEKLPRMADFALWGTACETAFWPPGTFMRAYDANRLAREPSSVTVALSTALGNPNHIALAKLTRQSGGDVNAPPIRVFDTALDAVADVVAGKADVCAVTAASVLAELNAGRIRVLGISGPERLSGPFAATPTWQEQSVDCSIGAWRGVTGPVGITSGQVTYWEGVLRDVTQQPVWREEMSRLSWSPIYQEGTALRAYLDKERAEFVAILRELGLLKHESAAS